MKRRFARVFIAAIVSLLALPALGRIDRPAAGSPVEAPRHDRGVRPAPAAYGAIDLAAARVDGVAVEPLQMALDAVACAVASGALETAPRTLTLIDYSRPSVQPRLWVYDLKTGQRLFEELVAHGRNTGENVAARFSDAANSLQSSLGLFVARDTYIGSNGYSLRMDGLEPGFNGRARERAIVMHGAWYVDAALAAVQGRLGRSWGCPALREAVARHVIDTIRDGGAIFSYYPDADWLRQSPFLNGCGAGGGHHIAAP